jgi:hypothetical protein
METMLICAEAQKSLLLSRVAELDCRDPARASDMVFEMISATLDHELLFGRFTTTFPTSDVELIDQLTDQAMSILGVSILPDVEPALATEPTNA